MSLFQKSYECWKFYEQRDLLNKVLTQNVYELPKLNNFTIIKKKKEEEDIYSAISTLILLFDQTPYLIRLKNSSDNKLKNTILGAKLKLNNLAFFAFFFRYKTEESYSTLKENILASTLHVETNQLGLHIKQNLFDEFLVLYDKFPNLSDILLNLHFVNCQKKEEQRLLLSNLVLF